MELKFDEIESNNNDMQSKNIAFEKLLNAIRKLFEAYDCLNFSEALKQVRQLYNCLHLQNKKRVRGSSMTKDDNKEEELSEFFVQENGMKVLLKLFDIHMANPNYAKTFPSNTINKYHDLWNVTFITMREILLKFRHLSSQYLTNAHIEYLFSLLLNDVIFDSCSRFLEIALQERIQPITLSNIPRFNDIIKFMDVLQTAKLCRLLSFMVYNSADKRNMSNQKIDVIACMNIVNKNQMFLLQNTVFLDRLMTLVNLISYGPTLKEMTEFNVARKIPVLNVIIKSIMTSIPNEWSTLNNYQEIIKFYKFKRNEVSKNDFSNRSYMPTVNVLDKDDEADNEKNNHIENNIFKFENDNHNNVSPNRLHGSRILDILSDLSLFNMSLQTIKNRFEDLLQYYFQSDIDEYGGDGLYRPINVFANGRIGLLEELDRFMVHFSLHGNMNGYIKGINHLCKSQFEIAKMELEYNALILSQYQLEILFVVSNLLCGERRHIFKYYAGVLYGFGDSLLAVLNRMGVVNGKSVLVNCIQAKAYPEKCLTVMKNFFEIDNLDDGPSHYHLTDGKRMLIHVVEIILQMNRSDPFVIWLNTCFFCFMKGCDINGQNELAKWGLIEYYVLHFLECESRSVEQLKSGFDALAEMIVGNQHNFEVLEKLLTDEQLRLFFGIVFDNIDSAHKFVKALFWTIEHKESKINRQLILREGRKFISNISYMGENKFLQQRRKFSKIETNIPLIRPFHQIGRIENALAQEMFVIERLKTLKYP